MCRLIKFSNDASQQITALLYIKRACELNKSHIISTVEDPGLRIESFAVINLRGVSTNKTIYYKCVFNLQGRHNSGSIYVFSCGNGAHVDDSCAFDGYVNSIYTIPVASISKDGKVTGFSERCGAIMTAVYSSEMASIYSK
jgi:hypothetical protein